MLVTSAVRVTRSMVPLRLTPTRYVPMWNLMAVSVISEIGIGLRSNSTIRCSKSTMMPIEIGFLETSFVLMFVNVSVPSHASASFPVGSDDFAVAVGEGEGGSNE
jgi:hypothetical protein